MVGPWGLEPQLYRVNSSTQQLAGIPHVNKALKQFAFAGKMREFRELRKVLRELCGNKSRSGSLENTVRANKVFVDERSFDRAHSDASHRVRWLCVVKNEHMKKRPHFASLMPPLPGREQ
jgi:hypothetical protein